MIKKSIMALIFSSVIAILPAHAFAQMAVVDAGANASLVQQVTAWASQLRAMTDQYNQLTSTYNSLTGGRGMERLVPLTNQERNYLPRDYQELINTVGGNSNLYFGISAQIKQLMDSNGVLTTAQIGAMNPEMRNILNGNRQASATADILMKTAYQNTSQRFSSLQVLIDQIGNSNDLKAIEDLQARITAEQAMLTNEQTKLQSLQQMIQAEETVRQQHIKERAIQDIGSVRALRPVTFN